ncbi:M23 family metallopeptidase [Pseudopedobacter beijingensis]|uniref:M23 family metallopeptidase n=1 Tax=Pseudopedobacter beijingensis TaxID=1207056 RepID=A0ABW4IG23_9SPHI
MSKRKKLVTRLKEKYKLVVLNDTTFEEKISFKASLWYLIIGTAAFSMAMIFFTVLVIKVTPLKEYLIGVSDVNSKRDIIDAHLKVDSLEQLATANALYLDNLKKVISGNLDSDIQKKSGDTLERTLLNTKISKEEQELRKLIESESQFDLSEANLDKEKKGSASFAFFSPIKGRVTESFDQNIRHFGVDIAARKNENIKAVLDGTVVFSSFTPETGNVIAIQHRDNLLSFYKHCSALLKKTGTFVRAGEVIAVVGNTGEYTTGPHLHFELWINGNAVNPENYITF